MSQITQETRRANIAQAVASVPVDAERRPMTWRGEDVSWPVVKLPVADVLLNPSSHRIKAQIKSLGARGQAVLDDPWSAESQETIADIIRATKDYPKIKGTIARDRQQDPGVISHEGVLVNANTRAVVLRDLVSELNHQEAKAFEYIKVHVLPSDASTQEITQLELSFQMRPNIRQDYTFTNQLLFIQDLLDANYTPEQIGLEMNRTLNPEVEKDRKQAERDVQGDDRIRQMIQELIEAGDGALKWQDFDDEIQALKDIDQTHQTLKEKKGPDVARRVRQAKLAGVLAGLDYRKVRLIDDTYLDDYVLAALEEDPTLKGSARALALGETVIADGGADADDPLEGIGSDGAFDDGDGPGDDTGDSGDQVTLTPLFDLLVRSGKSSADDADKTVTVPTTDGATEISKDAFLSSVLNAMTAAASQKERDNQGQDALDVPRKQIAAAGAACDRARRALDELAADGHNVDRQALERAYEAYTRSHDELTEYMEEHFGFADSSVSVP